MTSSIKIPQTDPHAAYVAYRAELDQAWRRVMDGGRYILGPEVSTFEREFAEYLAVPFAVSTANGTDAVHLALRALGVGPGHQVLTVSHTAVATVAAIVLAGAEPIYVDIDPITFTMDPNKLEDAIRSRRRAHHEAGAGELMAVLPVHLYGHPADMPAILDVATRHELRVLEDCAQSHGAMLGGRQTGTWGDIAAFSFYPTKNLGAFGDGGMVVTREKSLADRCRRLREYGWNEDRVSLEPGVNSRLDELQAALLRVKLSHLEADNRARSAIADLYNRLLAAEALTTPAVRQNAKHAYHQYVIRSAERDALRASLRSDGIATLVHYPLAAHQQPGYAQYLCSKTDLTETERAVREILSLPMYPQLSAEAAATVAESSNAWAAELSGRPVSAGERPVNVGERPV